MLWQNEKKERENWEINEKKTEKVKWWLYKTEKKKRKKIRHVLLSKRNRPIRGIKPWNFCFLLLCLDIRHIKKYYSINKKLKTLNISGGSHKLYLVTFLHGNKNMGGLGRRVRFYATCPKLKFFFFLSFQSRVNNFL
jgi:hypothetical protein